MSADLVRGRDTVVVIPCYNEAKRLDVQSVVAFASSHPRVRFLFVDDGSTDNTAAVLTELCDRLPEAASWLALPVNGGKAEAVRQGVLAALSRRPAIVGYWDADLATPLASIDDFVAVLDANPALLGVLGSRVRRLGAAVERRALRHYAGRIFATLASFVLGIAVYDTQCGAKMFRAGDPLARSFASPFLSQWIFDVEVLARLRIELAPEALPPLLFELPLARWHDVAGSKLTTMRGAAAFLDLLRIARRYR
jgi:dolichyl-phosphate beta-glucosyltransferase